MKVTIAEDDEDSRILLATALEARGHEVQICCDGLEALERVRNDRPDILISDILMPRMDGFDLCRIVKADAALHDLPFVFYTATYTDSKAERLGLALGASRFLIKPMEIARLVDAIEDIVTHAEPEKRPKISDQQEVEIIRMQLDTVSQKLEKKISDIENANIALQLSEQRFKQLAENIRECFWIASVDGKTLHYGSPAMMQIWGFSPQQRIADPAIWLQTIHPDDRARVTQQFLAIRRKQRVDETFRIIKPDGSVRWLRDRAFPVFGTHNVVYRMAGLTADVTEAHDLSEELTYHATHDLLTGLMNRQTFEKKLETALASVRRNGTEHVLCYLDLDQFKVVNDTCGHPVGDKLLRQIAAILSDSVRRSDSLARLGGDEFAVLMENCTLPQAGRGAQVILSALGAFRFEWEGARFNVGASIGLVSLADARDTVGSILAAADAACYAAKNLGGQRTHIYSNDDQVLALRHGEMAWATRLNQAIDDDRLEIYYQAIHTVNTPQADTGRVELLVRLRDTDGRLVAPGEFIPAANRYNITERLDRRVLEMACEWLAGDGAWVSECAVNLCAPSLSDYTLTDRVKALLKRYNLAGSRLCFEITEAAAIGSLADASRLMRSLGAMGCRFAVDDFGSGFSSFVYLRALPLDYLKIDGPFVAGMNDDPVQLAMVKSINEIGHVMGKRTVAEWVENNEALARLDELGIDFAQGFGLSRPRPC